MDDNNVHTTITQAKTYILIIMDSPWPKTKVFLIGYGLYFVGFNFYKQKKSCQMHMQKKKIILKQLSTSSPLEIDPWTYRDHHPSGVTSCGQILVGFSFGRHACHCIRHLVGHHDENNPHLHVYLDHLLDFRFLQVVLTLVQHELRDHRVRFHLCAHLLHQAYRLCYDI